MLKRHLTNIHIHIHMQQLRLIMHEMQADMDAVKSMRKQMQQMQQVMTGMQAEMDTAQSAISKGGVGVSKR